MQLRLLQGTLDVMILKVLSTVGPNHGYDIVRQIKRRSDDVLLVEEGSLYPALHRLEKRGYLQSSWQQSKSNRRAKFYELTDLGYRQLKDEVANWNVVSVAVNKILAPTIA